MSDDAVGWIGIALGLIAAIILDKGSPPHKWHAAIMWTFLALLDGVEAPTTVPELLSQTA